MLYTTVTIKEKEYKLRLNARACVDLEKVLGTNPINVFANAEGGVPSMDEMFHIFHQSLQAYQHNIDFNKACDLYDDYVEDGHTMEDFIGLIIDIFTNAGFVPKDNEEKN